MTRFHSVVILPSGGKLGVVNFRLARAVVLFIALFVMTEKVMVMVVTLVY